MRIEFAALESRELPHSFYQESRDAPLIRLIISIEPGKPEIPGSELGVLHDPLLLLPGQSVVPLLEKAPHLKNVGYEPQITRIIHMAVEQSGEIELGCPVVPTVNHARDEVWINLAICYAELPVNVAQHTEHNLVAISNLNRLTRRFADAQIDKPSHRIASPRRGAGRGIGLRRTPPVHASQNRFIDPHFKPLALHCHDKLHKNRNLVRSVRTMARMRASAVKASAVKVPEENVREGSSPTIAGRSVETSLAPEPLGFDNRPERNRARPGRRPHTSRHGPG
jgi:hypothetical protein